FATYGEDSEMLQAMDRLFGSPKMSTINRIDFALGMGALDVTLPERSDTPDYDPDHASLFAAGDGDDTIRGNSQNNIIAGGEGDDEIIGGQGKDLVVGGWGDDTIVDLAAQAPADGDPANGNDVYIGGISAATDWLTA